MKLLNGFGVAILIVSMLLPIGTACAQIPAKKPLPQMPIIYPLDKTKTTADSLGGRSYRGTYADDNRRI